MNTLLLGALTLSLAPSLATSDPGATRPSLADDTVQLAARREPGLTLVRTVTGRAELTGSDLTVKMDGQDVPSEYLPQLSIGVTTETTVHVVDHHAADALVRSFEALAGEAVIEVDMGGYMGQSDERIEAYATSPLEGRAVRFAPAEDGAIVATFVAAQGTAEAKSGRAAEPSDEPAVDAQSLLAGLRQDLDLAAWLPDAPVAVGARWKAPAEALRELMEPSGALAWKWSRPDAEEALDARTLTGDVELELVRVTESAGRTLAALRVSGTFDHVTTRATDLADVPVADGTATETREARTTIRGDLVWDVAGGHLAAAELSTELVQLSRTAKDPGQEGPEYESTLSFSGTEHWQVTVARSER